MGLRVNDTLVAAGLVAMDPRSLEHRARSRSGTTGMRTHTKPGCARDTRRIVQNTPIIPSGGSPVRDAMKCNILGCC